jgi:hypothetical protein
MLDALAEWIEKQVPPGTPDSPTSGWRPSSAGGVTDQAHPGAGLRSLYTSHFRALPLALPFYCAGLALSGERLAALAGLAVLALVTLVAIGGHRLAPIQRHHA